MSYYSKYPKHCFDQICSNHIADKFLIPFLRFTGNLLQNAYIIFQENVGNFRIVDATFLILAWVTVSPLRKPSEKFDYFIT